MEFDPFAILIFLLFIGVPLARRFMEQAREGDKQGRGAPPRRQSRMPRGPIPGGPVAFPTGRPWPPPPAPRPEPAPAEAAGEGVSMEGPADMSVEDVAAEAEEVASRGERLGERMGARADAETRRLAAEANLTQEALRSRIETALDVAPDLAPATAAQSDVALDLRSRAELARAIVLAEVLGPPRARRPISPIWRR